MIPKERLWSAVRSIGEGALFRREDVETVRAALASLRRSGAGLEHPSDVLGPWENLPETAQAALRAMAADEIRRTMAYYPRGTLWPSAARGLLGLARGLRNRGVPKRFSDMADDWAARVWSAPRNMRRRLRQRSGLTSWRRGKKLSVEDLLVALGRSPSWLLGDYATEVPVDPRCRGYFHDRGKNIVWGYLIGIDLINAEDGVWCVEANPNTAFNQDRRDVLIPEPAVEALFRAAADMGAQTVWWHGMDRSEIRAWLMEELYEAGRSTGIRVEIREDYRVPGRPDLPEGMKPPEKRLTSPEHLPEDTLVLRRNNYGVGTDYVFSNKEPFIRGVGAMLRVSGDKRVRLPAMTRIPADITPPSQPGLPNLVYKYPDFGKGQGVYFISARTGQEAIKVARSIDRKTGEPPGLFQPFVRSRLLPGKRIYDVRAEIFVSPIGVYHVFSIRREATRPLPESAGSGLLDGAGIYTSNLATGGKFAPVHPDEEERVSDAAMAVGEALASLFSRGFITHE